MKTVTYTLRSEPDRVSNSAGPRGRRRPAGRDNVVDLAAWRAEHLAELDGPETGGLPASAPERRRCRRPVRRRWTASDWAELAATLAGTAAFLALAARVLLF